MDCTVFSRALYIQSDVRKDTENWFHAVHKAMSVSGVQCVCDTSR